MERIKKYIISKKSIIVSIIDICIIILAYYIGTVFITDSVINISNYYWEKMLVSLVITIIVYELVFHISKIYRNIIRYETAKDYIKYVLLCIFSAIIVSVIRKIFHLDISATRLNLLASVFIAVSMVGYRVIIRFVANSESLRQGHENEIKDLNKSNLLIIGAGSASSEIIRTIKSKMKNLYNIIGIIDDNPMKLNKIISGIEVIGNRNNIVKICKEKNVDLIFFTISQIDKENRKQILDICQKTNAKVRILPGIQDLIKDKKLIDNLRDVEIEDILGRDAVKLDNDNIENLIKDQTILVTGAGGSIGSELCRQIVTYNPKQLIMLDIYENSLYSIDIELKDKFPNIETKAIIASIRDKKRLDEIFKEHKPYLVFHAAAHKHVPLMENSPVEAIKNNVFGTYNVINACDKYEVRKFILISTDKAVNPTNIMGATKRICEMIVQAKSKVSKTEYAAVRFGNVLGSNGSVVPLFKKQIANGGPVTVTHKEITRFFMTIPEAVELVLQAMTYAKGGEIFVLDMGEPVKIYDLAESLIRLSGYVPNKDIKIEITGLRPGEKLYEEILMSEEGLEKTNHNKIYVAEPMDITIEEVETKLEKLNNIVKQEKIKKQDIINTMKEVVLTYKEPEEVNEKSQKKEG